MVMVRTEILALVTLRIILLERYDLSYHIFFHPDYTVGCGMSPHQRFCSQAFTAGQEFHLAPKIIVFGSS